MSCNPYLIEILGFLVYVAKWTIGIAWPAVALTAIFMFREPISDFIQRVREGEVLGVKAKLSPRAQENQSTGDANSTEPASFIETPPAHRAFIDPLIDIFRASIPRLYPNNPDTQREAMFRVMANLWANLLHEKTFREIFRSQMLAVIAINMNGPLDNDAIKLFYTQTSAANPEAFKEYTYEMWCQWMINEEIIIRENDKWALTPRGQSFITYMQASRSVLLANKVL